MGENLADWLKIVIIIALVLLIGGVVFFAAKKGKTSAEASFDKVDSFSAEAISSEFEPYDNQTVRGDAVLSAIRKYAAEDFTVAVTTSGGSEKYNTPNGYKAKNKKDSKYIEVNGRFDATLDVNSNGSVMGIDFKFVDMKPKK